MKKEERYITKVTRERKYKEYKPVYVRGEKNGRTQYFELADEKDLNTMKK